MTCWHILRTLLVAALATLAIAAATQVRAEGGEGDSVYAAGPVEPEVPAEAAGPAEPPAVDRTIGAKKPGAALQAQLPAQASAFARVAPPETEGQTVFAKKAGIALAIPLAVGRASVDKVLSALIARHAAENHVPVELADAVVRIESRYDASARNGVHMGLTQINVDTARSLGFKGEDTGLFDVDTNLRYGLRYLAQAYRLAGGDTCGTILRYQAGHRALTMTRAARVYCTKVQTILAEAN